MRASANVKQLCGAVAIVAMSPGAALAAETGASPTGTYVLLIFAIFGLLALIAAMALFPNSRRSRRSFKHWIGERVPFLMPLLKDKRHAAKMAELRGLAEDLDRDHREGVIEVYAHDLGRVASPNEQTVAASFEEMKSLEEILERAEVTARDKRKRRDDSMTRDAIVRPVAPRKRRGEVSQSPMQDLSGEDEIPFDLLDPALKPQLRSSKFDDAATAVRDVPHVDADTTVAAELRPLKRANEP